MRLPSVPTTMRRPARQTIGSSRRGNKRGAVSTVSATRIINVTIGTAVLITGAAHFLFADRSERTRGSPTHEARSSQEIEDGPPLSRVAEKSPREEVADHSIRFARHGDARPAEDGENARPDEDGENARPAEDGEKYHIVFSTDCSAYQHWQSYVLFYSALKIGQPGYVTRIASGCTDEEAAAETEWHDKHIRGPMSDKFGLHLTPHFSSVTKGGKIVGKYEFFNKPYGLRHWMEHGEGMGVDPKTGTMKDEEMIVILLDPDQILLRPFSDDFSNDDETIIRGIHKENRKMRVTHGTPFGQLYGLGGSWLKFNLDEIAGEDSPAKLLSIHDANRDYPAGPPYLATARDMYQIAIKWTDFAPKVHAEYPHLLAEMYAYCIAAAHSKLPHQIVESMMVSNTEMNGEAWDFVDKVPAEEVCEYASNLNHKKHALPNVLHHCQRYMLGKHFFGKRRLPKDFFTCESPMLIHVPGDIALKYNYRIPPPPHKPPGEKKPVRPHVAKRETFMLCALTAAINEAADFFKRHGCDGVEGTNFNKSMDLWNVRR